MATNGKANGASGSKARVRVAVRDRASGMILGVQEQVVKVEPEAEKPLPWKKARRIARAEQREKRANQEVSGMDTVALTTRGARREAFRDKVKTDPKFAPRDRPWHKAAGLTRRVVDNSDGSVTLSYFKNEALVVTATGVNTKTAAWEAHQEYERSPQAQEARAIASEKARARKRRRRDAPRVKAHVRNEGLR